jgi:mannose-6-phosphate isomerase
VASDTFAINPEQFTDHDGISMIKFNGELRRFDELLKEYPEEMLGRKHVDKFGAKVNFLTKILDSAIRLPLQVHPDLDDAAKLFNSTSGKTEAWIVLSTRDENACLYMGFNENLDEKIFREEAESGNMTESLKMVHRHQVKSGDVLLIKGGMVHAIGPGVNLIEIMEPSDWCVQPERFCGDFELTEDMRFGLPNANHEAMIGVFDFIPQSKEDAWNSNALIPKTIYKDNSIVIEECVDRKAVKFFGACRATVNGKWQGELPFASAAGGIVVSGSVKIGGESFESGDTFFVPFSAGQQSFEGNAVIIFSLPPEA